MAKKSLSLEEQVLQADIDELRYKIQQELKRHQFLDAQVAYDAIEKIYKRSRREWAKAQRLHVKAIRKLERLRQQVSAAGANTQEPAQHRQGS